MLLLLKLNRRAPLRLFLLLTPLILLAGCETPQVYTRTIETTAYCPCGECNGYTRGSWKFLKLDFWNRYVDYGSREGAKYTGKTAGGGDLVTPRPGLLSYDSLQHPWMIPVRLALPWTWFPRYGTIAADTRYYPFGTVMYVPGWGWGVVDDVGGAIKGPNRLDLYHRTHGAALAWGRRNVTVEIYPPS